MIIWSGYGFLIFIIVFIGLILVVNSIIEDDNFYETNMLVIGPSFLLSAVMIKNYFNVHTAGLTYNLAKITNNSDGRKY